MTTSAGIEATVHDSATVTGTQAGGTPTGTVTFTVYSIPACTTGAVAETHALSLHDALPICQTAVQTAGGISFSAHYNGSTTYNESTSVGCEQLSPVKLDSSVTTAIHNAVHAVITSAAFGATVHDSATVTGTQAGCTPTGTVSFTVYSSPDCTTGGVARTPVALSGGVAHPSQTATHTPYTTLFPSHYNGSTTYNESTSVGCEQLSPVKLDSSV